MLSMAVYSEKVDHFSTGGHTNVSETEEGWVRGGRIQATCVAAGHCHSTKRRGRDEEDGDEPSHDNEALTTC